METIVKTSGIPDHQARQICNAIELMKDDIRILKEDNSFNHNFGTEQIHSYYIDDPELYVSVQPDSGIHVDIVIAELDNMEGFQVDICQHTVTAKIIDWTMQPSNNFEIEFELHLKEA